MSDKIGGNFSVETYIAKQEILLVEYIRRALQAETKITILESALQEMYKNNEELTKQNAIQKTTIDQSISGLQATTNDKDKIQKKFDQLEKSFIESNDHADELRRQINYLNSKVDILENENEELNNKVQTAVNDYDTLKDNYNKVLNAFEEANAKVERFELTVLRKEKKSKKISQQHQDSEWVDGEYKIPT